jgi:hypothetical protein
MSGEGCWRMRLSVMMGTGVGGVVIVAEGECG